LSVVIENPVGRCPTMSTIRALLICNTYTDGSSGLRPLPEARADGENVAQWLKAQLGIPEAEAAQTFSIRTAYDANATSMQNCVRSLGKDLEVLRQTKQQKPVVCNRPS
jgi:hypothetical protein